jgi:hypothetical protein
MYRENGKAVFPSIRSMIRQAEQIGRQSADVDACGRLSARVAQDARFAECVEALGYGAAMAIVNAARENRAAEMETANR